MTKTVAQVIAASLVPLLDLAWFNDPGHGWLRVPLVSLNGYEPSAYSYMDDEYAYLEEDCDAPGWATHVGLMDAVRDAPEHHCTGESFIRFLNSFESKP